MFLILIFISSCNTETISKSKRKLIVIPQIAQQCTSSEGCKISITCRNGNFIKQELYSGTCSYKNECKCTALAPQNPCSAGWTADEPELAVACGEEVS